MTILAQTVHPGSLEPAFRQELARLAAEQLNMRLWNKDASLWPPGEIQARFVERNLSWLDLPVTVGPSMVRVWEYGTRLKSSGIEDLIFVALGDSNLAARAISRFAKSAGLRRVLVLDSIDPDSIRAAESDAHLDRTLFVFASKSGKKLETHALLLYFLNRIRASGDPSPAKRFVAVTEENSYLAELAQEYGFAKIFYDPPGVSGRYSGLIHFGLLLAGICLIEPAALLSRIEAVCESCGPAIVGEANPALALAATLAAGANGGHDRLIFFASESLTSFAERVSQLVGVSSGKRGRGIIPIVSDAASGLDAFQSGCIAVFFTMKGDRVSDLRAAEDFLGQAGVPVVKIDLEGPEDLPGEMFKWELATALVCSLLGVNPFQEPDLPDSRKRAMELVQRLEAKLENPAPTIRIREASIELFAERATRQEISTLSLMDALRTFFDARDPLGYVAVLAFLDQHPAVEQALHRLQGQLQSRLKIPVQLSFGPRYLHQLDQLFLGGPGKGHFLILTAEPAQDLGIPGAQYTFGQLEGALAQGDFESLAGRDRLVIHLHFTQGAEPGLNQLEEFTRQALARTRSVGK